jgi:propionyl-CoA carboxylase alpha chain
MEHPAFTSGNFDTHFIRDHYQPALLERKPSDDEIITAALFSAYHRIHNQAKHQTESTAQASISNWKTNRKLVH